MAWPELAASRLSGPRTLVDHMRLSADDHRHGVTVISNGGEQRLSYPELFALSDRIAAGLSFRGVAAGDRIIIVLPQGFELMAAFLACIAIGAIPSILPPVSPKQDPRLYWRDMGVLLARIEARLLITFEAFVADADAFMPGARGHIAIASELVGAKTASAVWRKPEPEDVAFLQHSSGTTAVKKGVMITHAAAVGQLRSYGRSLALSENDKVVSWLPLYHDMGLIACFLLPVMLGLDLVLLDTLEWVVAPSLLLETFERHAGTLAWLPNFAFQHICDATREDRTFDLTSVRALINCSETCRPETMEGFTARFADCGLGPGAVQTCYAMAETVFAVSQSPLGAPPRSLYVAGRDFAIGEPLEICAPDQATRRLASCGAPIEDVEVHILDTAGAPLGPGVVGQIAVRAPFLFNGYYRLPDETATTLADGWVMTGDLGLVSDGEIYVTGRLKDMLIVHGKNIMAHDVEAAIGPVAGVKAGRAVALGVFDPRAASDNLVAIIECDGADVTPAEVKREVKRAVARTLGLTLSRVYVAPSGWIVKSTSGKLNRRENLEKFLDPDLGAMLV